MHYNDTKYDTLENMRLFVTQKFEPNQIIQS